jgi:hypothetical protein
VAGGGGGIEGPRDFLAMLWVTKLLSLGEIYYWSLFRHKRGQETNTGNENVLPYSEKTYCSIHNTLNTKCVGVGVGVFPYQATLQLSGR